MYSSLFGELMQVEALSRAWGGWEPLSPETALRNRAAVTDGAFLMTAERNYKYDVLGH